MHAGSRTLRNARLRAVAILLVGVLGFAFGTATRSEHAHKRIAHTVAVLAVNGADTIHSAPRADHHGIAATRVAAVGGPTARVTTSDSSEAVSSHPARAPQVRGPPAQALA
jgi:hypothetical protein